MMDCARRLANHRIPAAVAHPEEEAHVLEWLPVGDSSRVAAIAYRESSQQIFVRFRDGAEWCYEDCPLHTWRVFSSPGTSKGKFIASVLDRLPNHEA